MKANAKDKIVTIFYIDEAIFYEKIKTVNMNEVSYGVPRTMAVQQLFTLCENVMFMRSTDDFFLFPVISSYDLDKGGDVSENVILNKIAYDTSAGTWSLLDQSIAGIIVDGTPV